MINQIRVILLTVIFVLGLINHTFACHVPHENVDSRGDDIAENWKIDAIDCHDEAQFWKGALIGVGILSLVAIVGVTTYNQSKKIGVPKRNQHKITPIIKPKTNEVRTIYTFAF